jgi:hypothetical protein
MNRTLEANELKPHITASNILLMWIAVHSLAAVFAALLSLLLFRTDFSAIPQLIIVLGLPMVAVAQEVTLTRYLSFLNRAMWSLVTITGGIFSVGASVFALSFVSFSETFTIGSSALAGSISNKTPSDIERVLLSVAIGALAGMIIGASQSLVFRPFIEDKALRARLLTAWMLSNIIAGMLCLGIISALITLFSERTYRIWGSGMDYNREAFIVATAFVTGIIMIGVTTGFALKALIRNLAPQASEKITSTLGSLRLRLGIVSFSIVALIIGLLWLWGSYNLAFEAFAWPRGYTGPYDTSQGVPEDVFFVNARLLTGGMAFISSAFIIIVVTIFIRFVSKPYIILEKPWKRYWSVMLMAFTSICFFNTLAYLMYFRAYTD